MSDGPDLVAALNQALLSAFPAPNELEKMVAFQFRQRVVDAAKASGWKPPPAEMVTLNAIAGGHKGDLVFALINWADAHGFLQELVEAARCPAPLN